MMNFQNGGYFTEIWQMDVDISQSRQPPLRCLLLRNNFDYGLSIFKFVLIDSIFGAFNKCRRQFYCQNVLSIRWQIIFKKRMERVKNRKSYAAMMRLFGTNRTVGWSWSFVWKQTTMYIVVHIKWLILNQYRLKKWLTNKYKFT